jgi:hypothetical protein
MVWYDATKEVASMIRSILAASVICLVLISVSAAATWHVEADATGDVPTIQAAVDSAAPGDTVLLASGTYTGSGNYNIVVPDKAFLLTSATGDPADCVVDCEGHLGSPRRGFDIQTGMSDYYPVIRGITVRNGLVYDGYNYFGGAVYCEGSITMRDCVFESNEAGGGGAIIFHGNGEAALTHCTFASNRATENYLGGGAVFIDGVALWVTVDSCAFYYNQASVGGAICCYEHEAEAYIQNSLFVHNGATFEGGGIIVVNMYASIGNCTFHANDAPEGSGVFTYASWLGYTLADVRNCIIAYGAGGCGYYQPHFEPTDHGLQCTNIFGNEGGDYVDSLETKLGVDGNFSAEPAFCNSEFEPYDLSLCDGSPCMPGNHPDGYDCGLIGALGEGCICGPTRTQPSTWGGIKALYR